MSHGVHIVDMTYLDVVQRIKGPQGECYSQFIKFIDSDSSDTV